MAARVGCLRACLWVAKRMQLDVTTRIMMIGRNSKMNILLQAHYERI